MLLRIQHLERRQSFRNILRGKLILTANNDVCHLRVNSINHPLESHLLEIKNDVLHSLDHTRNRRELLVHAGDLDLTDSKTFQRGEKYASESVTDSLAVSRLERPELKAADSIGAFEHYHLVRFLKCQDCHNISF